MTNEYNVTIVITVAEDNLKKMEQLVNDFMTSLNQEAAVLNIDYAIDKNKD